MGGGCLCCEQSDWVRSDKNALLSALTPILPMLVILSYVLNL
jgi:hypothetical protein